jgi:hypothetical protein
MKLISKIYPEIILFSIYIKKIKNKKQIVTLVIPNINFLLLNKTNNNSKN